jgi:hypothetical protein
VHCGWVNLCTPGIAYLSCVAVLPVLVAVCVVAVCVRLSFCPALQGGQAKWVGSASLGIGRLLKRFHLCIMCCGPAGELCCCCAFVLPCVLYSWYSVLMLLQGVLQALCVLTQAEGGCILPCSALCTTWLDDITSRCPSLLCCCLVGLWTWGAGVSLLAGVAV